MKCAPVGSVCIVKLISTNVCKQCAKLTLKTTTCDSLLKLCWLFIPLKKSFPFQNIENTLLYMIVVKEL